MRVKGIDHVVLLVRDMEASLAFYASLGCNVVHSQDQLGLVHLRAGPSLIDLVDRAGPLGRSPLGESQAGRNMDHLCLSIEDFDVDRVRDELAAHGIESEPPAVRFGAGGSAPTIYLRDPDDNGIELRA